MADDFESNFLAWSDAYFRLERLIKFRKEVASSTWQDIHSFLKR